MIKQVAVLAAGLLFAAGVAAEQAHGVQVYPGAKADAAVAKQIEKMGIKGAATYRTSDSVKKVAEFYRKQGLKEMPGTSDSGAMFEAKGATLTLQNPYMDMDTNKIVNETLVSIVKDKAK